jgi:prolyl-tRNA editing enzyme YbaK/EbsC (Cys-tRNA(Pro) deacylase)
MKNNFTQYIDQNNISITPIIFDSSTKTAQDAATSLGCQLGQIAKTISFWSADQPILVIASGPNRIDLKKLENLTGEKIKIMTAREVSRSLGYAIGGVPPFGYPRQPLTFLDQDLFDYQTIYSAAGSPNAVFKTTPQELKKLSCAQIKDIRQ